MSSADILWWSKARAAWIRFPFVCLELRRSAVLHRDLSVVPADMSRLSGHVVYELWMEAGAQRHIWPSFLLHRSGNLKARSCSTSSAASAWTVRPRWGLWSSLSVAPSWPASPGSRRSSRELQLSERQQQNGNLQKDSGCCALRPHRGSKKSHNCTCVMSPSNYCSPSSPWQESLKTFEGLERSLLGVLCPVLHLCRMLRSSSIIETFSLKTVVSHLTFSFLCVSGSWICLKLSSGPQNNSVYFSRRSAPELCCCSRCVCVCVCVMTVWTRAASCTASEYLSCFWWIAVLNTMQSSVRNLIYCFARSDPKIILFCFVQSVCFLSSKFNCKYLKHIVACFFLCKALYMFEE